MHSFSHVSVFPYHLDICIFLNDKFIISMTFISGTALFGSALLKALAERAAIEEQYSSNENLQEELILHSQ